MMDESRFSVRSFAPEDYTKENPLTAAAWSGIFDGYRELLGDELFAYFYDGWKERKYAEFHASMTKNSQDGRAFTIVDKSGGSIAAMGSYALRGNYGVICSNAVRSDLRGFGIGSAMYRTLLASMRAEGIRCAEVTTGLDDAHAGARRAYERAGFGHAQPLALYFRKNSTAPDVSGFSLPAGAELRIPDEDMFEDIAAMCVRVFAPIRKELQGFVGDELYAALENQEKLKYAEAMASLKNPDVFLYALYIDGKPAGFCRWQMEAAPGGFYGLAGLNGVADGFKGRGLGLAMQKFILRDMLAHGIEYSRIPTGLGDAHAPARRVYEKVGFDRMLPSVTYRMKLEASPKGSIQ